MAEGAGQEGLFWDAYPWVISDKSTAVCSEKKSAGDKNLLDLSIDTNQSHMKQPEIGGMHDSSGGDRAATTVCGACKRINVDDLEMKNEQNEPKVSVHDDKGKRKLEPGDDDLLIWTERERRKKMRNMFHQLHALIPHLPPKADKCTIVDEAVSYIKTLQQTLQNIETKKLERFYGVSTNTTNASLIQPQQAAACDTRESFLANQGSSTGHFGIGSPPGSTSFSFQLRSPKVFRTWASSNVTLNVCGPDAHINICSSGKLGLFTAICLVLEKHKLEIVSADISADKSKSMFMIHAHANTHDPFMETLPYDDIYEQAATEIMQLLNSKSS